MRRRLVRWSLRATLAAFAAGVAGLAALFILDLAFPPPIEQARAEFSRVVADAEGRALRAVPIEDGRWRLRADLDEIDPAFIRALIAYEDERFYDHAGVDPVALARAALSSASAGRIVSGGSTITMQTARLMEPRPRNLVSKAIEMFRAFQLERRLSKREILELYLTLAPYGGNIEGVRAASWAYFDREPDQLTPDQIALLIALPQSPEARRPDRRPEAAVAARSRVLARLVEDGLLAADRAEDAREEPAPARRAFPAIAWQASDEVLSRGSNETENGELVSTILAPVQLEMEAIARRAAEEQGDAVQVSMIVVEVETRAVRAAVGSAARNRPGGWLDLTNRARSPGSTLKPLVYGMAFDDGLAGPGTLISDLPRRFAGYRPDNFDRRFRGDVTIAQALQHSLNVPAVSALDAIGARRFAAALSFAGAAPSLPPQADDEAGLALALGGAGFTARDIAVLYAALADGGLARPLVWLENEIETSAEENPGYPILTAESAEEVLEILRRAPAPDGRMPAALTQHAPDVAFKTGTSYGFRDAWAAGVANGHVVVIWVGRPDGAPRPGVTGRAAALPILFEAFDRLALDYAGVIARRGPSSDDTPTPVSMTRFGGDDDGPEIIFPPEGAEVWADRPGRSFVLSARSRSTLSWYVDGEPAERDASGEWVWRPQTEGFFRITAVDAHGRSSHVVARALGASAPGR